MQTAKDISDWLVLGPISIQPIRRRTTIPATGIRLPEIVKDIDDNVISPADLTTIRLLGMAPKDGDAAIYGNGRIFERTQYTWRALGLAK